MNNVLEVNDEAKSGEAFMFALSISSRSPILVHPHTYLMNVIGLKTMKKFHQSRFTWETIPSWKLS
jgi:hypothetical protein